MSGLINEAPRGEGRRGANRRLLAGGLGSAPVVTLTGARPICSAGETSLSAAIRLLAQRLVKAPAMVVSLGRVRCCCATSLASASRLIVPLAPPPVSSAA